MTGSADPRLRAHVYGLAAMLGVLVRERPGMSLWRAESFADGRVEVPPIVDTLSYHVALHELAHTAMGLVGRVTGAELWERECQCHAWARSVALVQPDAETERVLARALGSYSEEPVSDAGRRGSRQGSVGYADHGTSNQQNSPLGRLCQPPPPGQAVRLPAARWHHPLSGRPIMAATKKAASAAAKPDAPMPEAARAAVPEARPLFTGADGKTLSGVMAVLQVMDRYGAESGELAGLPRTLELVGTFPTTSHTGAAGKAREAGTLAAEADAVTLNVRFVSAVDVPREQPEPPAAA